MKKSTSILLAVCVILVMAGVALATVLTPPAGGMGATKSTYETSSPFAYQKTCSVTRQYIPLITNVTVAALASMGEGSAAVAEIATSEVGGVTLTADNESASVIWMLPGDIDLAQPISVRVLFSESTVTAGSVAFALTYRAMSVETTVLAVAATSTGVTNASAVPTSTTANVLQWSGRSTIAGGTLSGLPGVDVVLLKMAVDLTTVNNATIYGFQVEYSRKFLGCGE